MTDQHVVSIEVFALWTGFAYPPQRAAKLTVCREEGGSFRGVDELTGESRVIERACVDAVIVELNRDVPTLEPFKFPVPAAVIERHFGSVSTDDSPSLLLALRFANGRRIRCLTCSQHAFLLPFTIVDDQSRKRQSFNRDLSEAIAQMMPPDFLLRTRLLNGNALLLADHESMRRIEEMKRERAVSTRESTSLSDDTQGCLHDVLVAGESVQEREMAERNRRLSARLLRRNSIDTVIDVLSRGADPSIADEHGQTALMHAAFPPFRKERFRLLVDAGADLEARRSDGLTGLHIACAGGEAAAAEEWIRAGADVNARTPDGSTPLMLAVGWSRIIRMLLDAGADVNALDNEGQSAIVYLIDGQRPIDVLPQFQSLEFLLESGVDLTRTDESGLKPLDHAERAVRRCEIENEAQKELCLAWHDGLPQKQPKAELRSTVAAELGEEAEEMFGTDYDPLRVAEAIRDRLRSHVC